MDGWTDGRMDGSGQQMEGQMNGWTNGQMDTMLYGWMDESLFEQILMVV
jgi:hypothetical protein